MDSKQIQVRQAVDDIPAEENVRSPVGSLPILQTEIRFLHGSMEHDNDLRGPCSVFK